MKETETQRIVARINEGLQLHNKGKLDAALDIVDELVDVIPEDTFTQTLFGVLCGRLRQHSHAVNSLSKAVLREPSNPRPVGELGVVYMQMNRLSEAYGALTKALELDPENVQHLSNFGAINLAINHYAKAAEVLEKAVAKKPSDPSATTNLALAYKHLNRYEEAMALIKKALKAAPNNPKIVSIMARMLTETGQTDQAIEYFQKALRLDPSYGNAFADMANARKFSKKDANIIKKFETALKTSMPAEQRKFILYGLGKIFDDCKDWDKAFSYYNQANLLAKSPTKQIPPRKLFKLERKVFTRELLANNNLSGSNSTKPVFVVGMPRSGTTLIEQIISSHPLAAGAGELREIGFIHQELCMNNDLDGFRKSCSENLNQEQLEKYADIYLSVLQQDRSDADRIVDKMPENYLYLGLIKLLFPQAVILHAVRHPLDTCLSCYFQAFNEIPWSFDLEWISDRYRFYREKMDYWENTLPANSITPVKYEELVSNPEPQIRRLLEACGLPWDPACLEFNKTSRAVKTASLWQVRQPMYKTSRARWTHYAAHIEPLAKELGEYITEEDRAILGEHGVKLSSGFSLKKLLGR